MRKNAMRTLLAAASCFICATAFAQTDNALMAAASKKKPEFLRDLATLVNIDSGTDDAKGLGQVETFLAQRLKKLGAKVEIVAAPPSAGKMVLGTLQGKGSKNIMLMIHFDTVFGVGEAAKRPFRVEANKAFGPGVADAKGGALIVLYAVDLARERGIDNYKTLTVLFNPDEEKGSAGSREMIRKLSADQDYVLIYEPPEADRVTVSTNGIAHVNLDVKGLASHAGSAPEKGRNAAVEIANQIVQLKDLGDPVKGTTVSWTIIQAGDRANIIPDKASAIADMRMSDLSEIARVQADADKIVQKKLIVGTEVSVKVEYGRPPFSKNPASDHLAAVADQIYRELGKSIAPVGMRYGTDAGFAYNQKSGKPVVLDGMGIVGDRIHSSDEWADLDSVAPRLYLTTRLLQTLAKPDSE